MAAAVDSQVGGGARSRGKVTNLRFLPGRIDEDVEGSAGLRHYFPKRPLRGRVQ